MTISKFTISYLFNHYCQLSGTADTDGGAYSPFRTILLVLTHDFIIIQLYGPAGGDGQDGLNDADAGLRTILDAVCGEGGAVCLGPRPAS